MSKRRLILLFVTLILWASLVAPVLAQEATVEPTAAVAESVPTASESAPIFGASTCVLLLGIGAVVIVGGRTILLENAKRSPQ